MPSQTVTAVRRAGPADRRQFYSLGTPAMADRHRLPRRGRDRRHPARWRHGHLHVHQRARRRPPPPGLTTAPRRRRQGIRRRRHLLHLHARRADGHDRRQRRQQHGPTPTTCSARRFPSLTPAPGPPATPTTPTGNLTSSHRRPRPGVKYSYDALNRKTAEYATSATAANELASWTYDTLAKGQLTSSSSYTGGTSGSAYTEAITGYDALYQPTGTKTTIPSAVTGLNGSYTTTSTYTSVTGLLASTAYSADGGLPAETVGYSYDLQGLLTAVGGSAAYLDEDIYTPQGQIQRTTFGNFGQQLVQTYTDDPATDRLLQSTTNLQTLPPPLTPPPTPTTRPVTSPPPQTRRTPAAPSCSAPPTTTCRN